MTHYQCLFWLNVTGWFLVGWLFSMVLHYRKKYKRLMDTFIIEPISFRCSKTNRIKKLFVSFL